MFVSHNREKLVNAIVYFLRETKHCHTLKLFKLLNFADFEHFRQTGRTITGLDYRALPQGPVPTKLFEELRKGGAADLRAVIALWEERDDLTDELLRRVLKPKSEFDSKFFTKRELNVLARIAEFFKESKAADMSEFSHMKHLPWANVYQGGKGSGNVIAPDLILKTEGLMKEAPTIDDVELEYRRELLRDSA
jgi:uncharacterized phage-associated protein